MEAKSLRDMEYIGGDGSSNITVKDDKPIYKKGDIITLTREFPTNHKGIGPSWNKEMHYLIGIPVEVKAYDKDKDTYKIHDDSKDETWFLPADFVKKHGKTTFKLDFTTKKKSFWAKIKEEVLK